MNKKLIALWPCLFLLASCGNNDETVIDVDLIEEATVLSQEEGKAKISAYLENFAITYEGKNLIRTGTYYRKLSKGDLFRETSLVKWDAASKIFYEHTYTEDYDDGELATTYDHESWYSLNGKAEIAKSITYSKYWQEVNSSKVFLSSVKNPEDVYASSVTSMTQSLFESLLSSSDKASYYGNTKGDLAYEEALEDGGTYVSEAVFKEDLITHYASFSASSSLFAYQNWDFEYPSDFSLEMPDTSGSDWEQS